MAEIVLLLAAEGDAFSIWALYEERGSGRGELFSDDLDRILDLLRGFPHLGPIFDRFTEGSFRISPMRFFTRLRGTA